jgi:hypothetical protein
MTRQRELWERKLDTVEEYLREQREGRQADRHTQADTGRDTSKETR